MSVEAMALVLHHSKASGTAKLILVGIANHDGDGGAYPSIATLAKYGGVHIRSVKRHLRHLEELGEIRIDYQGGGDRRCEDYERPNLYHVLTRCPPECDGTTKHKTPRRPGDTGVTPPGDTGVTRGVTVASPKPSLEPPVEPSVSELHSPAAAASGAHEDPQIPEQHTDRTEPTFVDWRPEDLQRFTEIIGTTHIRSYGTGPWNEGDWSVADWYKAFRNRKKKPMNWPGQYFDKLEGDRAVEDYLAALGLEPVNPTTT